MATGEEEEKAETDPEPDINADDDADADAETEPESVRNEVGKTVVVLVDVVVLFEEARDEEAADGAPSDDTGSGSVTRSVVVGRSHSVVTVMRAALAAAAARASRLVRCIVLGR